jgi:predicted RNase H-like HicB family nuclease
MAREYTVIIERGETGVLIGSVAGLPQAVTQAENLDELLENMRDVITLVREECEDEPPGRRFVGVHWITL